MKLILLLDESKPTPDPMALREYAIQWARYRLAAMPGRCPNPIAPDGVVGVDVAIDGFGTAPVAVVEVDRVGCDPRHQFELRPIFDQCVTMHP